MGGQQGGHALPSALGLPAAMREQNRHPVFRPINKGGESKAGMPGERDLRIAHSYIIM